MDQNHFSATSSSIDTPNSTLNRPTCRFFLENKCIHGAACFFSHSIPGTSTIDTSSTNPTTVSPTHQHKIYCKFFLSGYCLRGSSCYYVHEYPDDDDDDAAWSKGIPGLVAASHQSADKGKAKDQAASSIVQASQDFIGNSHDITVEDPTCAICFESPTTFGLLAACSHAFCLTCIREWRKNRPQSSTSSSSVLDSNLTKTCPLCRKPSPFVVPSSTFPTTEQHKQQIVSRYQGACGKIPCKYFERSSPGRRECPFGDECFFRHAEEGAPDVRVFARKPHRRRRHRVYASSLRVEGDELRGFLAALFGVGPEEDYLDWLDDSWSVNPLPDDDEDTEFIRRVRELEEDNGEVVERSIDMPWDIPFGSFVHYEDFGEEDVDSEAGLEDGGDVDNDDDQQNTTDGWGTPTTDWEAPTGWETPTTGWDNGWGRPSTYVNGWGSDTSPWHQESHLSNSHMAAPGSGRNQTSNSISSSNVNTTRRIPQATQLPHELGCATDDSNITSTFVQSNDRRERPHSSQDSPPRTTSAWTEPVERVFAVPGARRSRERGVHGRNTW